MQIINRKDCLQSAIKGGLDAPQNLVETIAELTLKSPIAIVGETRKNGECAQFT